MDEIAQDLVISDQSKDILIGSILELKFVESKFKLQTYRCCLCNNVAIKHFITNCEDVFCHCCFWQVHQQPCPVCQTVITEFRQDEDFERTIFKLKVACESRKGGCDGIVHLGDFLDHISVCRHHAENCLLEADEADQSQPIDASGQANAHCQETKNVVQQLQQDIKQLERVVETITKKRKKERVRMEKKLDGAVAKIRQDVQGQLAKGTAVLKLSLKDVMREVLMEKIYQKGSIDSTFKLWCVRKVEETSRKSGGSPYTFKSCQYSIPSHGVKFTALLKVGNFPSQTQLSLAFTCESSASFPPFTHSVKFILVDQSAAEAVQDVVVLNQPCCGENTTRLTVAAMFFPVWMLKSGSRYVKDDSLSIRFVFEPVAVMLRNVASRDGTLLLRIDQYSKRKREASAGIRKFVHSESFYTSAEGHRVDVTVNLKGFGGIKETGICVFPVLRIGEWDDPCPSPVRCKYWRCLIDQSDAEPKRDLCHEDNIHFQLQVSQYTFKDFVSHETAEKMPYLKDDSLLLKFVIRTE